MKQKTVNSEDGCLRYDRLYSTCYGARTVIHTSPQCEDLQKRFRRKISSQVQAFNPMYFPRIEFEALKGLLQLDSPWYGKGMV